MTCSSWKQFYASLPSNEVGNQNIGAFTAAIDSQLSKKERRGKITEEINDVVLTADHSGKIQILHSLKIVGGTRLRPENKILALIGTGPNSVPVIVDEESLLVDCNIASPKIASFNECDTVDAIKQLVVPRTYARSNTRSSATLAGSAFFLVAPIIRDTILSAETTDPLEIILLLKTAAAEFDAAHSDDENVKDKATDHAEKLTYWLWGVANGKVNATKFSLSPEDGELQTHHTSRQTECILGSVATSAAAHAASGTDSVLAQLSEAMGYQTEEAKESNRLRREEIRNREERDDSRKNRLKKLHASTMNMITMAASWTEIFQPQMHLPCARSSTRTKLKAWPTRTYP